jgi:hypothetical protein
MKSLTFATLAGLLPISAVALATETSGVPAGVVCGFGSSASEAMLNLNTRLFQAKTTGL